MNRTQFRYDINGLRALAVAAVVLFHFRVPGFSGGFVGVDVFFVISGFLMTGIVVRGLEGTTGQGFRLFDFYMARARRIVPALLVLCVVLMVLGWFFLAPHDYVKLAREADRALLFISNNYYNKNSGYFDADSHERILLHTWSLSVEWQFYMLYPLVLMLLAKLGVRWLPYWIGLLVLVSLGVSIYQSSNDATYAFYMLPSRAWEMLIGGLVFYASRGSCLAQARQHLYFPGVFAVFLAIALYSADTRWPGIPALLPALGSALIIFAGRDCWTNKNFIAQRLGDWSYSIYLWHWPLVVALVLLDMQEFSFWSLALIGLSVLLGWLSYKLIENPLRKLLSKPANWMVLLLLLAAIATVLISAEKIRKAKGYLERVSGSVHELLNAEFDRFGEMDKCHEKRGNGGPNCFYGSGDKPLAIVMGDSHAMSLMPAIVDHYKQLDGGVLDLTGSGCPTIEAVKFADSQSQGCSSFFTKNMVELEKHKGVPVILSNRYSTPLLGANEPNASVVPVLYFDTIYSEFSKEYTAEVYAGYKHSFCKIAKNNPLYVFRPVPELRIHVPKTMGRALLYRGEQVRVSITRKEYEQRNGWANRLLDEVRDDCGAHIIDLAPYFCDEEYCYGDRDGKPLYFDDDHLNVHGASLLNNLIKTELQE